MMRFLTVGFCLFIAFAAAAQTAAKYSRVKIGLTAQKDLVALSKLGIETDHGEHARGRFFIGEMSVAELQLVRAAGFQTEVLIDDLTKHFLEQNKKQTPTAAQRSDCQNNNLATIKEYYLPNHFRLGTMGGYLTYEEMLQNLDSMALLYPNLISVRKPISTTNLTYEGRPMFWVKISDNPNATEPAEPQVFYNSIHHAREPQGLSQLIYYMWYLLERYGSDAEVTGLVNNLEMYFVPCVNPDGYIYNQTTNPAGGGFWRKNRRLNADSTRGVDLNRNYGYEWGFNDIGSSPTTSNETYRGTAAFSEPETQNMRDFCNAHKFKFALNYHTYSNLLIYPWGYSDALTPDSTSFSNFSKILTRENKWTYGTGIETVGYNVNGDADDWMYGEQTTKPFIFSMTPEVGPVATGFWPPATDIIPLSRAALLTNLTTAHLSFKYGLAADKSKEKLENLSGYLPFTFTRYGLKAGFITVNLVPVSNNIQSISPGPINYLSPTQFAVKTDSFAYQLKPSTQAGDTVRFALVVSNEFSQQIDTIVKIYENAVPPLLIALLTDPATNLNRWQNDATPPNWGTTTAVFYSAPSSITDSPTGNYATSSESWITLKNPVSLVGKNSAKLQFWAKWDTEKGYDFAQVLGSTDGVNFTPLCGNYTVNGTIDQDFDQPVYEDVRVEWVKEEIDLSNYLGGNFWVRFRLKADTEIDRDGFYFDDLTILAGSPTPATELQADDFVLSQNQPNPADGFTRIVAENTTSGVLVFFNALGQLVFSKNINTATAQTIDVETKNWQPGVYFYQIQSAQKISSTRRMVVKH